MRNQFETKISLKKQRNDRKRKQKNIEKLAQKTFLFVNNLYLKKRAAYNKKSIKNRVQMRRLPSNNNHAAL